MCRRGDGGGLTVSTNNASILPIVATTAATAAHGSSSSRGGWTDNALTGTARHGATRFGVGRVSPRIRDAPRSSTATIEGLAAHIALDLNVPFVTRAVVLGVFVFGPRRTQYVSAILTRVIMDGMVVVVVLVRVKNLLLWLLLPLLLLTSSSRGERGRRSKEWRRGYW